MNDFKTLCIPACCGALKIVALQVWRLMHNERELLIKEYGDQED